MTQRKGLIGIAALVLALAVGVTRGQELQLKEADIHKLIPVLRAQAADLVALQAAFDREETARSGFSGDPLEFIRSRAKVDLPQGARYVASCSRAASAGGPEAIFTFGRTIDCYERTWRDAIKNGPPKTEPVISKEWSTDREQTKKFLKDVSDALEKRGFVALEEFCVHEWFSSADGMLKITLCPHNTYDRANRPDDHPLIRVENDAAREAALAACSDMPSGPILVLRPGDRFFADEGAGSLDAALRKAGLSTKEYEALKEALFMARMDTQPEWFQAAEAAAGSDPAALRALTIRRANAALYRRFETDLGPLLDALVPRL